MVAFNQLILLLLVMLVGIHAINPEYGYDVIQMIHVCTLFILNICDSLFFSHSENQQRNIDVRKKKEKQHKNN